MKTAILITTVLFALVSCTGSRSSTASSMPSMHVPDGSKAALELFLGAEARPGMAREAKDPLISPEKALDSLKAVFPEYGDRVECFTTIRDHFVFSIRPDKSEKDPAISACSYSLIIYARRGEKTLRYYWLLKP